MRKNIQKLINKNSICYIMVCIVLGWIYFNYLHSSIGKLPLMDYWKESFGNGAPYLERVMTEPFQLRYIIQLPHILHWCPLLGLADYVFIRIFKCDNRAYVYAGMLITFISIALLARVYSKYYKSKSNLLNLLGLFLCTAPIINLNQWEIMTLWCNFQFSARIFLYLLMVFEIDHYVHRNPNDMSYGKAVIYSCAGCIIVLLCSQAYFPGYVFAIVSILFIDILINKNNHIKKRILKYSIIAFGHIAATLIYFVTLVPGDAAINSGHQIISLALNYLKGLLIMLGSTLIPQVRQMQNLESCYLLGILILCIAIIAVIIYFKEKMYTITYFPMACLLYAFISIVIIISGRIDRGIHTLTSSRYVVETTIGLIGLLQIYWKCIISIYRKLWKRILCFMVIIGIVSLGIWSSMIEMQIGPYRKEYAQNMVEMALNIENAEDEDISALFQAPAEDVRHGIAIMQKYHLNIWSGTLPNNTENVLFD